jgi:L-cysteine/cystine lyase
MAGGIDRVEPPIEGMLAHRDAPTLFESGTQNLAVVTILTDAVAWMDDLGWDWIEGRERSLAAYLRARLPTVPGVSVLTPGAWEQSSAITTFAKEGVDALEMQQIFWGRRIVTRYVGELNAIRISTPYFTSEEELDRLIAALGEIGSGTAARS